MDRRIDLTMFSGFHVAKLVSAGGTLPPNMTYDDVHGWIEEYCDGFNPVIGGLNSLYEAKLERALIHYIKRAFPDSDDEDITKLLVFALENAE